MNEFWSGRGPAYVATAAVWCYWLGVLLMAIRVRVLGASSAGLIPRQPLERVMWIVWVPVITGWILFPWLSLTQNGAAWQIPALSVHNPAWLSLRWAGAGMTLLCLGLTLICWRWMGRNWRVGVDADDPTDLITDGPFSRVRHPIYALSISMMVCTLLAVPIWPMLLITLLHIILMNTKAVNEERWMLNLHGQAYEKYRNRTGRFFPPLR